MDEKGLTSPMRILITAGSTREPIDPVRFLSNRSTGKMGYALAEAALVAGDEVILISGPVTLKAPEGVRLVSVETAQQMYDAVAREIANCDAAIFCAAVADYRPEVILPKKLKKSGDAMQLTLVRTPDILGSARGVFGFRGVLVGFAAETDDLEQNALDKLHRKGCDLLVANDVSRSDIGFGSDENEVRLFFSKGGHRTIAQASKDAIAAELLQEIHKLLQERLT